MQLENSTWWSDLLQLKDTQPLRTLSERFEVSPGEISAAFKRTGVQKTPLPQFSLAELGSASEARGADDELPPEAGDSAPVSKGSQSRRRGAPPGRKSRIEPHRSIVGVLPDEEVAAKAGVSRSAVRQYRRKHGIAAPPSKQRGEEPVESPSRPGRRSRIEPYEHLVGVESDQEVAAKAGVTLSAVRQYRQKHGIPLSPSASDQTERAPARKRASPAGRSRYTAWAVTAGKETHVVVATSLQDAAKQAEEAGLGEIATLQRVGPVVGEVRS